MLDQELLTHQTIIVILGVLAVLIVISWVIIRNNRITNKRIDDLHFGTPSRVMTNVAKIAELKKGIEELEQMVPSKKGSPRWVAKTNRLKRLIED